MKNLLVDKFGVFLAYAGGLSVACFFAPGFENIDTEELITLSLGTLALDLWLRASLLLYVRGLLGDESGSCGAWLWKGAKGLPLFALYSAVRWAASLMGVVLLVLPGLALFTLTCFVPALCLLSSSEGEGSWFRQGIRLALKFPGRAIMIAWLPLLPPVALLISTGIAGGTLPSLPVRAVSALCEAILSVVASIECARVVVQNVESEYKPEA